MESKIVNSKDFSPYLYEISLDLYKGTTKSSNAVVLATKDGKNLILSSNVVFDLDTPVPATGTSGGTTQTESLKCSDIAKVSSDKAMLEAFVVSYCPFGLQAQRALAPVAKLLPNNVKIRYIGSVENGTITAMHGDKEAKENLRQICLREEQPGKYWPYVECFIKADGKGDACLAEANVDKAKLDACTASTGNGLKYAQVDFGIATKLGIGGSPSLVLNGTQVSEFAFATGQGLTSDAARSADNLKNLVCCSMDKAAAVCSTALDKAGAATSFSTTYSAAGGSATTAGSGCGT
jgi:hypothetical protein